MPPPGCPIPEWVYPGRVLMSRHNQEAFVWIDSMRIAEDGTFRIACRRVLSFAPTVVSRFCLAESWAAFEGTYEPTDQWEPHPTFEWEPEMQADMERHSESCFIVLADGVARSWDIVSTGVEGPNMTMEVMREVINDEVPEGYMEPVEVDEVDMLIDPQPPMNQPIEAFTGRPLTGFTRMPHLRMPPAEVVPLDPPEPAPRYALGRQEALFDLRSPPGASRAMLNELLQPQPGFVAAAQQLYPAPTWLGQPPADGNRWHLRIRRQDGEYIGIFVAPTFQVGDELVWVTNAVPTDNVRRIGVITQMIESAYLGEGRARLRLEDTGEQVEIIGHELRRLIGQEYPPRGSTILEQPAIGALVHGPHGEIFGQVIEVTSEGNVEVELNLNHDQQALSLSRGRYLFTPQALREAGVHFETRNLWAGPNPAPLQITPEPEHQRPSVYDRILEDDDDD